MLPNPDDFKDSIMVLPHCAVMAQDRNLPAAIRLAAADLVGEEYSTVGAVLTNMCPKDLSTMLSGWIHTLKGEEPEDRPEGEGFAMKIGTDDAAVFLIFTMMVSRAEDGELKADPYLGGLKAELMASFMDAVLLSRRDKSVFLDLTKLSLDPEFLNQDFDEIISTQNFKSIQSVRTVKKMWSILKNSDNMKMIKERSQPKVDLSPSPIMKTMSKRKKGGLFKDAMAKLTSAGQLAQDMADGKVKTLKLEDEETKPEVKSNGDLSAFEARLRKKFGG